MNSLEEKKIIASDSRKKPWWILCLIALGLTILAIALIVFLPTHRKTMAQGTDSTGSVLPQSTAGEETPEGSSGAASSDPTQNIPNSSGSGSNTTAPTGSNTNPTTATTAPSTTAPTAPTVVPTTAPPTTVPPTTTQPATDPPSTQISIYNYRLVASGEEYNAGYVNSGNDIIITGVNTPSSNGVYQIPSYIDGKRVLVIAPNAFTGSGAKSVVVPATVKTIWGNAFAGCPLTDIYFCGSSIYAAGNAFSGITGSLTIHCATSCSDRNYRYYKDTAPNYGAVFAEWNG